MATSTVSSLLPAPQPPLVLIIGNTSFAISHTKELCLVSESVFFHDLLAHNTARSVEIQNPRVEPSDFDVLINHLDAPPSFDLIGPIARVARPLQLSRIEQRLHAFLDARYPSDRPRPGEYAQWDLAQIGPAVEAARALKRVDTLCALFYAAISTTDLPDPAADHVSAVSALSPSDHALVLTLTSRVVSHLTPMLFTMPAARHMSCTNMLAEHWEARIVLPALAPPAPAEGGDAGPNRSTGHAAGLCAPLETFQMMCDIDWEDLGVCASCMLEKREEWHEDMQHFWKLMGTWLRDAEQVDA